MADNSPADEQQNKEKLDNHNQNNNDNQEDTSSTASYSNPATGVRRRRRLAHRRQYAKSRRLASSFLRSQFVHYDNIEDRYEPADSWFKVQTFDNDLESSANNNNNNQASSINLSDNHLQRNLDDNYFTRVAPKGTNKLLENNNKTSNERKSFLADKQQQNFDSNHLYWTKFESDIDCDANDVVGQQQSLARIKTTTATGSELGTSSRVPNAVNQQQHDEAYFGANYSSSSLDSCSFIDNQVVDVNYCLAIKEGAGSQLRSAFLATTGSAKSLSFLPNYHDNKDVESCAATSVTRTIATVAATVAPVNRASAQGNHQLARHQLHGSTDIQTAISNQRPAYDRVVRSETIDLNRVKLCQSDSPKSKFFPGHIYAQHQHQQQQQCQQQQQQQVVKSKGSGAERFISLHNLVYSSSDSSHSQSITTKPNDKNLFNQPDVSVVYL